MNRNKKFQGERRFSRTSFALALVEALAGMALTAHSLAVWASLGEGVPTPPTARFLVLPGAMMAWHGGERAVELWKWRRPPPGSEEPTAAEIDLFFR